MVSPRNLLKRIQELERKAFGGDSKDRLLIESSNIVCAHMYGVISEKEAERQLAELPGAISFTPSVHEELERNRTAILEAFAKSEAAMTPEQREASDRYWKEQREAREAEHQRLIEQDPTRFGDTYAVLVPEWVKRRLGKVVSRAKSAC